MHAAMRCRGPRFGSCALATLALVLTFAASAVAVIARASNAYVLKHPKREHCRANYRRKIKTIRRYRHGHVVKVRETVCVHLRHASPKDATPPVPSTPRPKPPFATTTLLTATFVKGSCVNEGRYEGEECSWYLSYSTWDNYRRAAPGFPPKLQVRVPPSETEEEVSTEAPSVAVVTIKWERNQYECRLTVRVGNIGPQHFRCDVSNPRAIFTAAYAGWSGTAVEAGPWLPSISEPFTVTL
jgi:hypothetical protein